MSVVKVRWNEFLQPNFVSYRRYWLDRCLVDSSHLMKGVVIDLGGKREHKRGAFIPPGDGSIQWWYINLAAETQPNIVADIVDVPLPDAFADCIICTEVLEHLPHPAACVAEAFRMLRPGGIFIASVPFLYPVHADPFDYQRLTADGLRVLLQRFSSVHIDSMGGYLGTIAMMIEQGSRVVNGWPIVNGVARRVVIGFARSLYWLDSRLYGRQPLSWQKFTTGYFARAIK